MGKITSFMGAHKECLVWYRSSQTEPEGWVIEGLQTNKRADKQVWIWLSPLSDVPPPPLDAKLSTQKDIHSTPTSPSKGPNLVRAVSWYFYFCCSFSCQHCLWVFFSFCRCSRCPFSWYSFSSCSWSWVWCFLSSYTIECTVVEFIQELKSSLNFWPLGNHLPRGL